MFPVALAVAALAGAPGPAFEHLDMSSLPSSSGWTFVATNVSRTEAATASVAGGLMTFNTMGSGNQPGGSSILYSKSISPDWSMSWFIEASLRLNAFESFSNHHGVYFGSGPLWVGVAPDRLVFPDLSTVAFAPGSAFHTYRFEVQASRAWTFFVDDTPMKTGTTAVLSGALALRMGDGTGGSNGSATYDYYTFDQPIPAPGSALVAGILIGSAGARRRRAN
jgi:hypothetical protein